MKGLYKRARAGEIKEFTGISSPYEEPESPELVIDTENFNLDECVQKIIAFLQQRRLIGVDVPDLRISTANGV